MITLISNTFRQFLCLLFFIFCGASLWGQAAYQVDLLPQINASFSINKKWKLLARVEPRYNFHDGQSFVSVYDRTDASLFVSRKTSLNGAVALGYLLRQEGTAFGHRFSQQYTTTSKLEHLKLGHRFLADETIFSGRALSLRLRYRLSLEIPLSGLSLDPKEFYLKTSNEHIFAYRRPDFDYEIRTFAGAGYAFNKTYRLETGLDYRISNIITGINHQFLLYWGFYMSF